MLEGERRPGRVAKILGWVALIILVSILAVGLGVPWIAVAIAAVLVVGLLLFEA